jgi:quercetin dioxygenase-like cupin family protein
MTAYGVRIIRSLKVEKEICMYKNQITIKLMLIAAAIMAVLLPVWTNSAAQNQPSVTRKVLMQQDLNIPGYSTALVSIEIPAGGREGRHTHPGTLLVYVQEGTLTLDYEGKPTRAYKAGETFSVEPGKIHEGINKGNTPVKALASFVVEKGKPLTTQVQ